jgi:ACS family glucarate transporter-like MFS transporter
MKSRWSLVALLAFTATASYLCRVNVTVAGQGIMRDYGLSQEQLGRVFSAFLLGYAACQAPAGWLADRYGARRVLAGAAALWVAGAAWTAWAGGLAALLAIRFLNGVAQAPTFPTSARAVSLWVAPESRGRANGFILGAIGAGSAIAPPLVTWVMIGWNWRAALLVSAVPALIAMWAWMRLRPPAEVRDRAVRQEQDRPAQPMWSRDFLLLTASYTLQGYVGYIFVFWFYLYLVEERHFDLLRGALWSSLPWILSIVSIPAGGWVSDRLGRKAVCVAGLTGSGVLLAFGARTESQIAAAVTLAAATALVLSVEGPFWATVAEIAGPHGGLAGGIMNTGSNIGGLISPALTPWLAARMGWANALLVAASLAVAGGLLWMGIRPARRS